MLWNFHRRLLNVIGAIEMRVIDTSKIDCVMSSSNGDAFIEEDGDTEGLKIGNHRDRVMIAKNGIDGAVERVS